jgi:hypothetical protein
MRKAPRFIVAIALITTWGVTSCGTSGDSAAYPTYTPYPTYTSYPTYTPASSATLLWPSGSKDNLISWQDAGQYYGQTMTVEGSVVETYNSGKVVFLNFHEDYQDHFKAVIFPDDWNKFTEPPERLFLARMVRVTGLIEEYEGAPEIIVREPAQIEMAVDTSCPPCPPCPTSVPTQPPATPTQPVVTLAQPSATPTQPPATPVQPEATPTPLAAQATPAPQELVVSWQDAAQYYGQIVTIQGRVVETYNSGKVIFLNFHEDYRRTFKAVIFPDDWDKFPEPPEKLFLDKLVRVTGLVKEYEGAPEIIIEETAQIEIVEE